MSYYLSFDVEEWFHAHNLRPAVSPSQWDRRESRVVETTTAILDILDRHDTEATFFVLGWVADRHPELVGRIADRGHEVASHGYDHELLYDKTPEEVRQDVERSLRTLEGIVDGPVRGYRAPSFSVVDWALDVLRDLGIEYDSSSYAVAGHDRYGSLSLEADASETFVDVDGLTEVRLAQLSLGPLSIPWSGGGYFRFIPYPVFERGVRRVGRDRDFVFYLHPWELDSEIPRVDGLPATNRLRHYTNLSKTAGRLDALIEAFDWEPIRAAPDIRRRDAEGRATGNGD